MKYGEEQLRKWSEELRQMFPHIPIGFLDHIVLQYAKHEDTFNEVCEKHKINPIPPKPRNTQSVYDTTWSE